MTANALKDRFLGFEQEAIQQDSVVYARLSRFVAGEPELLEIAAHAPREPVPNLFLASVRYLLLQREQPQPHEYESLDAFRDFCLAHRAELVRLIETRFVQTNEVRRAACLLPAFHLVHARGGGRPLALVEIGSSAGLLLGPEHYCYRYGDRRVGADAPLELTCELRGDVAPPLPDEPPPVASRIGIDTQPVDLEDPDARLWLHALVWPDHPDRTERLDKAMSIVRRIPITHITGDALDLLPSAIASVPATETVCVLHSSMIGQLGGEGQARLTEVLRAAARSRRVHCVAADGAKILLKTFEQGVCGRESHVADYDGHGRWLAWR